ncbi:MAG: hypothetical protein U0Z53_19740 [Blastocatellia bacterium]
MVLPAQATPGQWRGLAFGLPHLKTATLKPPLFAITFTAVAEGCVQFLMDGERRPSCDQSKYYLP